MKEAGFLHNYGIRVTEARCVVLKSMLSIRSKHFSAKDILEFLQEKGSGISRASVFRTIALFLRKGIISVTDLGKKYQVYELNIEKLHHDHLYCLGCGKVLEFYEDSLEKLQDKICRGMKFYPLHHNLRIIGLCNKCKAKV